MTDGPAMGNPLATGTRADAVRPPFGSHQARRTLAGRPSRYQSSAPHPSAMFRVDRRRSPAARITREAGFRLLRGAPSSLLVHQAQLRRLAQQVLEDLVALDVVGLPHVFVP